MFSIQPAQKINFLFYNLYFENNKADIGSSIRYLGDKNSEFDS